MTQQQIIDAGIDYTMSTRPVCMGGAAFEDKIRQYNRNSSFEAGAKWADKTMVDKVCKWLEQHQDDYNGRYLPGGPATRRA